MGGLGRQSLPRRVRAEPARFGSAAGCFEAASTALGRYAATLASAQLAAGRARDLFAEGVRVAIAAGGPLGVDAGPLDVFLSPAGREQRLAAVELLERVRDDVDRAGNEAAECLGAAMASAPEPVSAGQHAWNFLLAVPCELNQERRDWAAGAAFGILDTLVLASNPLPIALWVGVLTKRQVNELEWRLGADARSGFHTAGAVVVPGVLTGAVGSGPARVGITITELSSKPPESINLFRGMRAAPDGFPELGQTAKTLGVRPNTDIPVVNGTVDPDTGGMSVNMSIDGIPPSGSRPNSEESPRTPGSSRSDPTSSTDAWLSCPTGTTIAPCSQPQACPPTCTRRCFRTRGLYGCGWILHEISARAPRRHA